MKQPVAVVINDVHYSMNTLEVADKATRMAIAKANDLGVELIVAGDLHDTKANMRAECVNAMLATFEMCHHTPYILRGNHDQINEKSEEHSLNFLRDRANIIDELTYVSLFKAFLIPYQHNPEECRDILKRVPQNGILIMHQGLTKTNSGHYIQDHSAINPEDVAGHRVISGHYHTRQDIKLPSGGVWTYTGNPYTLNYAEANDPPKGFNVLYDDGSLEFCPTDLRKHVVIEVDINIDEIYIPRQLPFKDPDPNDLVWVRLHGTKEHLSEVSKSNVGYLLGVVQPFKLDLIPIDSETKAPQIQLSQSETLDEMIDSLTNSSDEQKSRLKHLWKAL